MKVYTGHIDFISGVDASGAQPPADLPFRWAALTWFEVDNGTAEPWALMRGAVPWIAALVNADSITAEYWFRKRKGILPRRWVENKVGETPWNDLMTKSDRGLLNVEFPSRIVFSKTERIVLAEEMEFWSLIGGPSPYHDSVTLSFFSATDLNETLESIFTDEARKLGVEVDRNLKGPNQQMHGREPCCS
jgi:hypothetical protein